MKSAIISFLFERCIEHAYFWLCQNIHIASEKFEQFVTILRLNCITNYITNKWCGEYFTQNLW